MGKLGVSDWLTGLVDLNGRGEAAVLVTVAETRGSTPREQGAKMTVGAAGVWDTIGGGQLEHGAVESARLLLEQDGGGYASISERLKLGESLGQCCGGAACLLLERVPAGPVAWLDELAAARRDHAAVVTATRVGGGKVVVRGNGNDPHDTTAELPASLLARARRTCRPVWGRDAAGHWWLIDPLPVTDFNIVLFGGGHVGSALAGVLEALDCHLTWVDSIPGRLPQAAAANVRLVTARQPGSVVAGCPAGAFYLVMTHSHPIDFDICERVLARGDFSYLGMIGSRSKRRSLEKRLKKSGVSGAALDRLTCPIGAAGIHGKRPAEIAVAAAAEILQVRDAAPTGTATRTTTSSP